MWTPIHPRITETCLFWLKKIFCRKSKSKTPIFYCRNRKNQPSYKSLKNFKCGKNLVPVFSKPGVPPIDAIFAFFEWFIDFLRNLAMKTVLFIIENESSKCCLTCCENRKSKPCFVLEISPGVYRVLFSTSVEHRDKVLGFLSGAVPSKIFDTSTLTIS